MFSPKLPHPTKEVPTVSTSWGDASSKRIQRSAQLGIRARSGKLERYLDRRTPSHSVHFGSTRLPNRFDSR